MAASLVFLIFIASGNAKASLVGFFPSRVISVTVDEPTMTPRPCLIAEKIDEGDLDFDNFQLTVAPIDTVWTEKRLKGSKIYREPDRDVILKFLNKDTCEISFLKVRQHANQIIAPLGWDIKMLERSNGITFNYWNTAYQIVSSTSYVVLKNKFPTFKDQTVPVKVKNKAGKLITQKQKHHVADGAIVYAPYSPDLDDPALVVAGKGYLTALSVDALAALRERGVPSRARSGLVADVPQLKPSFFQRLPLLEQTDFIEFTLDPQDAVDRVLVIIAINKTGAYNATCSSASACGLMQFTPGTWNNLRKYYPEAGLMTFAEGARNHQQSMMAAVLLHDYNLANLIKKYGPAIADDPKLEEYLAASYNGKPARVSNSITASLAANISDWVESLTSKGGGLANETRGYMVKLRYLQEYISLNLNS